VIYKLHVYNQIVTWLRSNRGILQQSKGKNNNGVQIPTAQTKEYYSA